MRFPKIEEEKKKIAKTNQERKASSSDPQTSQINSNLINHASLKKDDQAQKEKGKETQGNSSQQQNPSQKPKVEMKDAWTQTERSDY